MKKSTIIINGIRAAEFVLLYKYKRYILNDFMILTRFYYKEPKSRSQFKFTDEQLSFDCVYHNLDTPIWRGFYSGSAGLFKVYIEKNEILIAIQKLFIN